MNMIPYNFVIAYLIAACCAESLTRVPMYDGCSKQYDDLENSEKCTHTLYCRSYVSQFESTRHEECSNPLYFANNYGNDYYFDPVSIVLRHDEIYDSVPLFQHEDNRDKVYSLDLSDNNYISVPNIIYMQNLVILTMSRCGLNTAKLSNARELPELRELDYSQNTINNIEVAPGEYEYKTLVKLNISHNYLVNIPEAIFDSFPNIEILDLSHNFIYVLDIMSFEGIRKLLNLNLSNNRIVELESSLLRLRSLVTLDLGYNSIQTLKASDFSKSVNLQTVKVNSNEVNTIEKNIFENMPFLTTVDLRDNVLESIDHEIFANATKLTTVYLSRNKFKILPKYLFKGKLILNFSFEGNELEGTLERGLFEGLVMVTELDLGGQHLTSVDNYAFSGLRNLKNLLLNNNEINVLSNYSFKDLQNLNCLDLSHNKIKKIEITTEDLISLQILSLHHNKISHISSSNFVAMGSLQFLDLSHNNISHFQSNSFQSLRSLLNFRISNNPLSESIEEKTFDGLSSLPSLDISGTLITAINNGSFMGMTVLRDLNVSHSNITELQYNSLSYVKNIRTIDLSYNQLTIFYVNTTDLSYLKTLILNNNMLQVISQKMFNGMVVLTTLDLSHNHIHTIHHEAFYPLDDIRNLDLSYNPEFEFDVSLVKKAQNLAKLFLSGTKAAAVTFGNVSDIPLIELEMAHSRIQSISDLNLHKLQRLERLVVSNNDVTRLEVGAFLNLTALKQLDLSYNNLSFIQPGVFKDSTYLNILNISHNMLTEISYGIFRGLAYLEIMDLSYNKIKSLHRARFYDVEHMSTLIVDHNDIDSISEDEFLGTSLSKLSIGGNPLPCEILASIDKKGYALSITAVNIDETNENVKGVTCNRGSNIKSKLSPPMVEHDKLLLDIRNILFNVSKTQIGKGLSGPDFAYFSNKTLQQNLNQQLSAVGNLTLALINLNNNTNLLLHRLNQNSANLTSTLVNGNNNTNFLLGRLLRELTSNDSITRPTIKPITLEKGNLTSENLIPFINKVKQDLEQTIAMEKQNIILDVDNKIKMINSRIESSVSTPKTPVHERLVGNNDNVQKSSMFTEVCVGLILAILVGFVLLKVYKSRLYIPNSRSLTSSTRNIAESMESSHL